MKTHEETFKNRENDKIKKKINTNKIIMKRMKQHLKTKQNDKEEYNK